MNAILHGLSAKLRLRVLNALHLKTGDTANQRTGFYWRDAHENRMRYIALPYFNVWEWCAVSLCHRSTSLSCSLTVVWRAWFGGRGQNQNDHLACRGSFWERVDNVQSQDVSEGCSFLFYDIFANKVCGVLKHTVLIFKALHTTLIKTIIDIKLTLSFLLCVFVRSSLLLKAVNRCGRSSCTVSGKCWRTFLKCLYQSMIEDMWTSSLLDLL